MLEWINSHGVETLIAAYILSAAVGTMPPLPETASYWQKWLFGFFHTAVGNLREAGKLLNIPGLNGNAKSDPAPKDPPA